MSDVQVSDAGQTGEAEGEEQQSSNPEIQALSDRMSEFMQTVESRLPEQQEGEPDPLEQFYAEQQQFDPQQQYATEPYGQQQYQQPQAEPQVLYTADGQPVVMPGQEPEQDMGAQIEQLAHALGIADVQQQVEQMKMMQRVGEFEAQYPELKDAAVYEPAAREAAQKAIEMGQPHLAADPDFVVMSWLAGRASQGGQSETPAGGTQDEVPLETAGGRGPGQESGTDEGDAMVAAFNSRRPSGW